MPPRAKKPTGPVPIESVQHRDKRTNLPTADAQELVTPEVEQARQALEEQHKGSATEKLQLHLAEQWRDRLIADDDTLAAWMAEHPTTDTQQLRALIRQARKDAQPAGKEANVQVSQGLAPRKGRAYRELFQLVREHLGGTGTAEASGTDEDEDHGDE